MDIIAFVFGFVVGIIIIGLAIEIGMKKSNRATPASRHTDNWELSEISNPRIIAEYLVDAEIPKNSKIVVNQYKNKDVLTGLNAKTHGGIKGNYIIGDDRALILSGPIKKNEHGIWTVEKDIVDKLNEDFKKIWEEGTTLKVDEEKK